MELALAERLVSAGGHQKDIDPVAESLAKTDTVPGDGGLFMAAPVALCVIDRHRRFQAVNFRMAALASSSPEKLAGRFAASLLADADTVLSTCFAKADAGEALSDLEIEWRGERLQLSFAPLRDGGRVWGLSVAATNISRRVRAEKGLRLSRRRLQAVARQDHLTGLLNRRGLRQSLHETLRCGAAAGEQVAVMLADIDHFKIYNDTFGHPAGDQCLKRVAEALDRVGMGDVSVARYGGEEFALIVRGNQVAAARLAERCRQAVSDMAIPHPAAERGQVTISAGVAMLDLRANTDSVADLAAQLMRSADRALYRAKGLGRDCVAIASAAL